MNYFYVQSVLQSVYNSEILKENATFNSKGFVTGYLSRVMKQLDFCIYAKTKAQNN